MGTSTPISLPARAGSRSPRNVITGLLLVAVLSLLAPANAYAAKPIRTALDASEPMFIPSGFGCSFDVLVQRLPGASLTVTRLDDFRTAVSESADVSITNLESGASITRRVKNHRVVSFDPVANDVHVVIRGHVIRELWPGDSGPYGNVAYPGLLLEFVGNVEFTADLDTGSVTAFSLHGNATEICPLIE